MSGDAVLLMTAAVSPEHAGSGLGRMLVQAAAKDLHRRNVRAMEAFGRLGARPRCSWAGASLPAQFLSAVGFKTVREHAVWPRMRLDLRTVAVLAGGHGGGRRAAAAAGACSRC